MVQYEEKFIVFHEKELKHLTDEGRGNFSAIMKAIQLGRINEGKQPLNNYYVCNQDEPYAPEVIKTILDGENQKANPVDAVVSPKIAGKKRRLKVITSQQQFEEFTNGDIEIINIDVKAVEQSYMCQDCFIAVIQYYESNFTA